MKPWKSEYTSVLIMASNVLQWGHGDEAVEEDFARVGTLGLVAASMGPRR